MEDRDIVGYGSIRQLMSMQTTGKEIIYVITEENVTYIKCPKCGNVSDFDNPQKISKCKNNNCNFVFASNLRDKITEKIFGITSNKISQGIDVTDILANSEKTYKLINSDSETGTKVECLKCNRISLFKEGEKIDRCKQGCKEVFEFDFELVNDLKMLQLKNLNDFMDVNGENIVQFVVLNSAKGHIPNDSIVFKCPKCKRLQNFNTTNRFFYHLEESDCDFIMPNYLFLDEINNK